MQLTKDLVVYLPDTRGVELSPYMKGNLKLGANVYSYSRLPGRGQTCPGSSDECEAICYAKRITGIVQAVYASNSFGNLVPPIPADCKLLRLHVSGDFDTVDYIYNWAERMRERPDVTMWTYTRSWRIPELLPALNGLRSLPNVQLFASVDQSIHEEPPVGWRRAWIDGDARAGRVYSLGAHTRDAVETFDNAFNLSYAQDGAKSVLCPEEIGARDNCHECGFCFDGKRNDVVFLKH